MHITLRMTIMLLIVGALKKVETLEPWLLMARLKTRGRKQKLNMYQSSWFLKTEVIIYLFRDAYFVNEC